MTISICVKVHDGVVLASDSASTVFVTDPSTGANQVFNVYQHADKIFNLYKGVPIGLMTWGAGSIGLASIATLAKDLRREFQQGSLNPQAYTMKDVAQSVCDFFWRLYHAEHKESKLKPHLGFFVSGYSHGEEAPELWRILFTGNAPPSPEPVRTKSETGISWSGEIEPITRLILGHGTNLPAVLKGLGVPDAQIEPAMNKIRAELEVPFAPPPLPIQDAINLSEFLVQTAIHWATYRPGPSSVGGPIEIAAITKHEGFRWVRRKYYFDTRLNPPVHSTQMSKETL